MFDRRQFMLGSAALAGCSTHGRSLQTDARPTDTWWDVIVIGAGVSGLTAANHLVRAGQKVVVIEARDRIGGRMWTDRHSMSIPVDRGCELIHGGPHVPTWQLVQQEGLRTHMFTRYFRKVNPDDAWQPRDAIDHFFFPRGKPAALRVPLPRPSENQTAQDYLSALGLPPQNWPVNIHRLAIDTEPLYNQKAANVLPTLEQCIRITDDPGLFTPVPTPDPQNPLSNKGDYRVIGGYDQILRPIAAPLDIRLSTVVAAVDYRDSGVSVETSAGQFRAARCVVAVPAGVLQADKIKFHPPLPASKAANIRAFKYLPVFKSILEFDRPVVSFGGRPTDQAAIYTIDPKSMWNASLGTPGYNGEIWVNWSTGDAASRLWHYPEQHRFEAGLRQVRTIASDNSLNYVKALAHDWAHDPFALGAYGRGVGPAMYEPVGTSLYWAGIQTSSVHTSYQSGIAAARAVLASV